MRLLSVVLFTGIVAANAPAEDWPQWMGGKRDGIWRETGIIDTFPKSGAKVLWRKKIGGGYAGPAVANDRVFVHDFFPEGRIPNPNPGRRDKLKGKERVICFNAKTGKEIWKHDYDVQYGISYAYGPRATPTVDGNLVFALGAEGDLFCFDARTGTKKWHHALKQKYNTTSPVWGFSAHPLVDGNRLYCLVGGKGSVAVCFDKTTGKEIWKSLSSRDAGYSPPAMINVGGKKRLVIWHSEAINLLDPDNGKVLWSMPLKPSYAMSIMAPQQAGDYLFASGMGNRGQLFKLDGDNKPQVAWTGNPRNAVYASNATPLIVGDTIFGVNCGNGGLMAVDLKSAKRLWTEFPHLQRKRRASHGTAFITKLGEKGNRYFLFAETGELIIADMTREGFKELSRAQLVEPTQDCFGRTVIWSHPAYAGRCVFARNDKEIVCVSLAAGK